MHLMDCHESQQGVWFCSLTFVSKDRTVLCHCSISLSFNPYIVRGHFFWQLTEFASFTFRGKSTVSGSCQRPCALSCDRWRTLTSHILELSFDSRGQCCAVIFLCGALDYEPFGKNVLLTWTEFKCLAGTHKIKTNHRRYTPVRI